MASSNSDASEYSAITDTQERLIIIDFYIISTIGLTLAILILYSLINLRRKYNEVNIASYKYYQYAIICGILSCISAIISYLIKILFLTDLIFPLNYSKNINIATTLDAILTIFFISEKLAFYYGFSFLYTFLFSKESMDNLLKIVMVLVGIGMIISVVFYFISDVMTTELDEIGVGEKRGIYIILPLTDTQSMSVKITSGIGICLDFIIVILLIYRFYVNGTRKDDGNGTKGIILIFISSCLMIAFLIGNNGNFDIKYLLSSMVLMVDIICLYLMFADNQEIYNNLCKCMLCCGSSSKYRAVEMVDVDDINDAGNENVDL